MIKTTQFISYCVLSKISISVEVSFLDNYKQLFFITHIYNKHLIIEIRNFALSGANGIATSN